MLQECHVLDYVIIEKNSFFYNIPSEHYLTKYGAITTAHGNGSENNTCIQTNI